MDQLVKTMEKIDLKEIEYYAQEIDKLCDRRNLTMNQTTACHHKKKKGNKKNKKKKTINVVVEIIS